MENQEKDILLFSYQNMAEQVQSAKYEFGYFKLKFYTSNGLLAKEKTENIDDFFLYPSGGTLRDKNFNIVFYDSRFDKYKGFIKPKKKIV